MLKKRFTELIEKLLSFKFVMFSITTVLRILNYVGNTEWLAVTLAVITGHVGMKGLHSVIDSKDIEDPAECGG